MTDSPAVGVALDVDGTLVDSTFQHAIAWHQAFRQHGVDISAARCHAHIGMGGDQLVKAVAGEDTERDCGDELRTAHDTLFAPVLATIRPLPGARDLLRALADRGRQVVLSSSAGAPEIEHYLDLLDARDLVVGFTTSDDVELTKPHGELVRVAMDRLGTAHAVMVGDSPWDAKAAADAGIPAVGVDTGGFGVHALREAGAQPVTGSLAELIKLVDEPPFVRRC